MRDSARLTRGSLMLASLPTEAGANTLIEASAGTGKTRAVVELVVEALCRGVPLDGILVVTFTERATHELRGRVRTSLEQILRREDERGLEPEERARLRAALRSFAGAQVLTIHGFCRQVLDEFAFASGGLLEQTRVEGRAAFRAAWLDRLRRDIACGPLRPELRAWLRHHSLERLENLLWRCARERAVELRPRFEPATLRTTLAEAAAFTRHPDWGRARRALRRQRPAGPERTRLLRALEWLARELPRLLAGDSLLELLEARLLRRALRRVLRALATLPPAPANQALSARLDALRAQLIDPLPAAVHLFGPGVAAELTRRKRAEGRYDFDDLLLRVVETLEGPGGDPLIAQLRRRYPVVLIDEFQDTDPVQWRAFSRLFFPPESGCSLYLVGDPKQAVYAFRGADVYTYLEARRALERAGGRTVALAHGFRGTPELIAAQNLLFARDATPAFFTGPIRYPAPVRAGRPELRLCDPAGREQPPVVLWSVRPGEQRLRGDSLRRTLAARIARELRRLIAEQHLLLGEPEGDGAAGLRPLGPGDAFVLTRTAWEGRLVAEALRAAGVPCVLSRQEGLFQSEEARAFADLLAALAAPRAPGLRLRALATPFFAASLAELEACRELPPEHPAARRLERWTRWAEWRDYPRLFAGVLEASGLACRTLFAGTAAHRLEAFRQLSELLLGEAERTRCTVGELAACLERWRARPPAARAHTQRLASEGDAVQVLTMHASKGLEAGIVFLFGGFGRSSVREQVHRYHDLRGEEGQVALFHGEDGRRILHVGPLDAYARARVRDEGAEEQQRLLYVAATRARGRLYLPFLGRDARGRSVYPRLDGCYAQLHRRLEAVVSRREREPRLRELFAWEEVPVAGETTPAPPPEPARLADWVPPPELLEPEPRWGGPRLGPRQRPALVASYSRIKRVAERIATPPPASELEASLPTAYELVGGEELPTGTAMGRFLHEVLELLPLETLGEEPSCAAWGARPEVARIFAEAALKEGIAARWLESAQRLVYDALRTPLRLGGDDAAPRLPRGLWPCSQLLRELGFHYALPRLAGGPGYVRGVIDALIRHDGRLYFLDWKSDALASYEPPLLEEHVRRNYHLQVEVYTSACARMARVSHADDYAARFGGVLYAFLRGMRPQVPGSGVLFLRPAWDELQGFEAALGEWEVAP